MAILLLAGIQMTASAQDEQILDLADGSIAITSTGYSRNAGIETPYVGGYIITGATSANTIQITSGNHTVILDGINIAIPATTATDTTSAGTVCAFSITGGSDITVTLRGDNVLTSAAGYAGLYTAEGSNLTIAGSGSLTANGGAGRPASSGTPSYGGGAGIGGNGHRNSGNFGTITIEAGNITATGGVTSRNVNYGAGAGIGSGGLTAVTPAYPSPRGAVVINGGVVDAFGGECVHSSATGGGAGIGSGGCNEEMISYVTVAIHDGAINAHGNYDGSGIGSGANCHNGGSILIDGGNIQAYGGDERDGSSWGGAGIGAGDMGWARAIAIGGNATVFADGGGAAAGIGAGNNGGIWDLDNDVVGAITIYGNAAVTSFGGSSGTTRGGAGIGAGRTMYPTSYLCNSGIITIQDNADVTAYAGIGAQAAGVGSGYVYGSAAAGEDILRVNDTIHLRLFNRDSTQAAYPPAVEGSSAPRLVAFTLADSGLDAFPGFEERTAVTRGEGIAWEYSGSAEAYDLVLFENENLVNAFRSVHAAFGNWAVLASPVTNQFGYTVEYYYDSILDPAETVTGTADMGSVISSYPPKPRAGYEWDRAENLPLTISGNPADNIIRVYYVRVSPPTNAVPTSPGRPVGTPAASPSFEPPAVEIPEVAPPLAEFPNPSTGKTSYPAFAAAFSGMMTLSALCLMRRKRKKGCE